MNKTLTSIAAAGVIALSIASCQPAYRHAENLSSSHERNLTVGTVQKEIRKGMSQAAVAESLGSPNIVTRDKEGQESWIYDKIASEASYSQDSGGVWFLIGAYGKSAGASSSTQKTLTIVIKFNADSQVDTFSYHTSKF